jgi:hypothetical protein
MSIPHMAVAVLLTLAAVPALAQAPPAMPLSIAIAPAGDNPSAPRMGDRLSFRTTIRNEGTAAVHGVIGWIALLRTDPGQEQPIDLEDWSAHKAITLTSLAPGQSVATDWPMRLISAGTYRVVVSAATPEGAALTSSPFADFTVRAKAVVESGRVLPVAIGLPLLLGACMLATARRRAA